MGEIEKQRPKKIMPVSPGRPKGSPNKINGLLKDAIILAAQDAGGGGDEGLKNYLQRQATINPGPFMGLLGKVLPMQVTGEDGGSMKMEISWKK